MPDEKREPRKIIIQLQNQRKSENDPIYNLDALIDGQIANLQMRQAKGEFDDKDFKKLEALTQMKKQMMEMRENVRLNSSEFEGKTTEEIAELVKAALDRLGSGE